MNLILIATVFLFVMVSNTTAGPDAACTGKTLSDENTCEKSCCAKGKLDCCEGYARCDGNGYCKRPLSVPDFWKTKVGVDCSGKSDGDECVVENCTVNSKARCFPPYATCSGGACVMGKIYGRIVNGK